MKAKNLKDYEHLNFNNIFPGEPGHFYRWLKYISIIVWRSIAVTILDFILTSINLVVSQLPGLDSGLNSFAVYFSYIRKFVHNLKFNL